MNSDSRSNPVLWEMAGAFGDIGVLFPIAIALISLCHVNPTALFLTAGLGYIIGGRYFQLPISLQPFKAVAAIALALQLSPESIATAGLMMGLLLALVGLVNVVTPIARLFSLPIVRGIQLGLGLILAREGLRLALIAGAPIHLGGLVAQPWQIAIGAAALLIVCIPSRRVPAALMLLAASIAVGSYAHSNELRALRWAPVPINLIHFRTGEFWRIATLLVLPQFALTFGNSIVATENTARTLYGESARRVSARALAISIGVMNLLGGLIVAPPFCHGSGGITAHYRFGARTPRASYFIGSTCLLLALFGRSSLILLAVIPTAVLGVFLVYVGIQHAALLRDIVHIPADLTVAACVGAIALITTNLTYGFVAGFIVQALLPLAARVIRSPALATLRPSD